MGGGGGRQRKRKKVKKGQTEKSKYDALKLNKVEFTQRTKLPIEIPFLHWSVIELFFFMNQICKLTSGNQSVTSNDENTKRLKETCF